MAATSLNGRREPHQMLQWNMRFLWCTDTCPPSLSGRSLEVVIVPAVLTSCCNIQEQLRGRSWQSPAISTQPDSHPAVSSAYNPLISSCPQFPPLRTDEKCSRGGTGTRESGIQKGNGVFLCASVCGMASV